MTPQEKKKALQKFFLDPEWFLVEEMLSEKTKDLRDISTIDLTLPAETIKAIVAGRQETLNLVDAFHKDVEQMRGINSNTPTTFK